MKPQIRRLLICLSLANLLFVEAWIDLNFNFLVRRLHTPVGYLYLAALADALVLTGLLFGIDTLVAKTKWHEPIRKFAFLACLLLVAKTLTGGSAYRWLNPLLGAFSGTNLLSGLLGLLIVGAIVAVIVLLSRWAKLVRVLETLVLAVSPLFLVNLALAAMALTRSTAYHDMPSIKPTVSRPGPRVVWIIFDAFDYHYAFEDRVSWLKLPELDRLRRQSVDFTHALGPGVRTEISIPGLMTGTQFVDQEITSTDEFRMTRLDGSRCGFRDQTTVFKKAEDLGVRTAVLGIHLPYGRLIGDETSYCRWWPWPNQLPSEESWPQAALDEFAFVPSKPFTTDQSNRRQLRNHLEEVSEAVRILRDKQYRLCFFHFFPPHQPAMYNARTGQYDLGMMWAKQPYENSLALADKVFGEVRRTMVEAGTWDSSLVIVTADHSLRTGGPLGYKTYPRIPFLCHFPGQETRIAIGDRTNTLLTHDLLLTYLQGKIANPADLAGWSRAWTASHPNVPLTDDPPGPPVRGIGGQS